MSKQELTKLIISTVVFLVFATLVTLIALYDFDFGTFKIMSVKTLLSQYDQVTASNDKLAAQQKTYDTTLKSVDTAESDFKKEKARYDSISDATLQIIKDATTEEKYDIEYVWVKLGNYAKANNLSIVLVEPGGSAAAQQPAAGTTNQQTTSNGATNTTTQTTSGNNVLNVQVTGNYLNVSDFIFELENDKELRFKLDNISMEYVGSNNIKTTFAVKNLVVIK